MISHDEMLDNVAVYALGTLPPNEAAAVAAHLEQCAECREEYRLLRPAVTAVGYSAELYEADVCPGPLLKARIMREVRGSPVAGSNVRWQTFATIAASLVFALGALLFAMSLNRQVTNDTARMAAQQEALGDLAAPDARRYRLGSGIAVVRGNHLYIALPDLPETAPGRVYQAWTLPKGAKRVAPSVTFTSSGRDETIVRLPDSAQTVAAVAVSVEPAGGSRQPTTKPIALATL